MSDKKLVLQCRSDNEDFNGECDWFVVDVTRQYARAIVRRVRILAKAQEIDKHAYELYFWDYHGDFFSSNDDGAYEEGVSQPQRTECQQMIARLGPDGAHPGVLWMCYPKHSDVVVTSDSVPYSTLLELAK